MASESYNALANLVDHIRSGFEETIQNITPQDDIDEATVFYVDTVKEKTSSYSIPYDLPKPKIVRGEIDSVGMKKANVKYSLNPIAQEIKWSVDEEEFDMSPKKFRDLGAEAGIHFRNLKWYALVDLLEKASGDWSDYVGYIPQAFDSLDMITSSTRWSNANGNTITGSGVATVDAIVTDIKQAMAMFFSYKNERNGNLIWKMRNDTEFLLLIPGDISDVIFETLYSKLFATTVSTYGASASNVFEKMFRYRVLDGLSSVDDWYIVINNKADRNRKAALMLDKEGWSPYKETALLGDNRGSTMIKNRERSLVYETYFGGAPHMPGKIIKINN